MTQEEVLKEALEYIAHCLESDEIYLPTDDRLAQGDEVRKLLVQFARTMARGNTEHWRLWCEVKAQQRQTFVRAKNIQ